MSKKSFIVFITASLILMVAMLFYRNSFSKINEYNFWVNHTTEVIFSFDTLANDVKSVEIMLLFRSTRQDKNSHAYTQVLKRIPRDVSRLRYLTRDNMQQGRRLDTLTELVNRHLPVALPAHNSDSSVMHVLLVIRQLISNGIVTEKALLAERKSILERSTRKTGMLLVAFTAISIVLIIGTALSNIYHVSRRKKAEQFLEAVLNTSQNAIITMEAIREDNVITDFRIIFANESVEKQVGFKPDDLIGKTMLGVSPTALKRGLMQKYIDVCETGVKQEFENYFLQNGKGRWTRVMLAKLNDGITSTLYDITDVKNYQKEVQQKVTQLEHTNNELEQFAYVASHDLQEPLRKIKTYASLVQDCSGEQGSFNTVYMSKIFHSANRMSNLISDLLNLTDLSKQQRSYVVTDLNMVVQNVLYDFELVIKEKSASITIGELQSIEAIPLQMNQLFYNLFNNALKFSRDNIAPVLSVKQMPVSPAAIVKHQLSTALTYQEIVISDNGIGFDEEYAEKIFTIFQRLHSKTMYSGSGIGLALCRKIIKNHNGAIFATAKPGEGASFHIILPLVQPESVQVVAGMA